MKSTILILSIILWSTTSNARDFSKVEIKTTKLSKNIYMLSGAGGNIGVSAGKNGVYIIDDQFAPLHDKIVKAIKKISKKPLKFVINTHWHWDHTGGNEKFGKSDVVIVAHENVRKRMSVDNFNKVFKKKVPAANEVSLPKITFPDSMTFHLNGEEAKITHFPNAHTDGDAIIHFKKSNIIHTGDLFFNGFYPFIDVDSHGSITGVINALEKIYKLANKRTKIIPGHGALATKADLLRTLEMLKEVKKSIAPLIASGKSIDEIVKMNPLKKLNKQWGNGFLKPEVFTKIVVNSLKH